MFHFAGPTPWFLIFVLLTSVVVIFGVEKGIEKASRIMMPILAILSILVAVYSLTIDGAMDGLKYYLLPDFSQFSASTVLGALGQLFYSMSLAMGIMITYGSYMQKENILEHSVTQIEIFDTLFAFVAGLMIIPAVVAFNGGDPSAINAGPGLMFVTLPMVFENMAFGTVVGAGLFRTCAVCSAHLVHLADGNDCVGAHRQNPHEAHPRDHPNDLHRIAFRHTVLSGLRPVGGRHRHRHAVPRLL